MRSDYLQSWACSLLRVFYFLLSFISICILSPIILIGALPTEGTFDIFIESPPDINHQELVPVIFSFPYSNDVPSWHSYRLTCEIPAGLSWEGWTLRGGKHLIKEKRMDYDSLHRLLTVEYPAGEEKIFSGTELRILLRGNCEERGVVSGMREIVLNICRIQENPSARVKETCLLLDKRIPITLQCIENTCQGGGMIFTKFDLERVNIGTHGSNRTPIASNKQMRRQRLMYGDTLRGFFQGLVAEVDSPLSWQYGFASSRIEHGNYLDPIGSQLTIYDYSTGRYLHCSDISISSYMDAPNRMFFYDISPEKLAQTASSFTGYLFEGRDSIWLETIYRVNDNLGDTLLRATVENRFYLSDVPNPTLRSQVHQCGRHDAAFTLLGFDFILGTPQQIDISYPFQEITQTYQFKLGGSQIFSGHDPFPFEDRYFGHIKRAQVILPPYYEYQSMAFEHKGTIYPLFPNQEKGEEERDTVQLCSSDTLTLNLEESLLQSRGSAPQQDGGFQGQINLRLIPQCEAKAHPTEQIEWAFTYAHSGWLNGGKESRWYHKEPDLIRYQLPSLQTSSYDPACNPAIKTLSWTLNFHNPQANPMASHSWLYIELPEPDSSAEILAMIDLTSGDTLQSYQDLFRLGTLRPNEDFLCEVVIHYEEVAPEFITVYSGFGCNGYPIDFSPLTEGYVGIDLFSGTLPSDMKNSCEPQESVDKHTAIKID